MLRDAMIFGGGILAGWLSMAGVTWLVVWQDERKYKEDC